MAFRISNYRDTEFNDINGTGVFDIDATVFCDTDADLPGADDIEHYHLTLGCRAIDVSTGDTYYLTSTGEWNKDSSGGGGGGGTPASDSFTPIEYVSGEIIDIDDYTTSGKYIVNTVDYKSIKNIPVLRDGFTLVVTADETNDVIRQEITPKYSTDSIYRRNMDSSGNWTDWVVYTSEAAEKMTYGDSLCCIDSYYFDSSVTCSLDGRQFTASSTKEKIAIIMTIVRDGSYWTCPLYLSRFADAVSYVDSYSYQEQTYLGTVQYEGATWYFSTRNYEMQGNLADASGNIKKYIPASGVYPDYGEGTYTESSLIDVLEYVYAFPVMK